MRKLHNEHLGCVNDFVENNQGLVHMVLQRIIKKIGGRHDYEDLMQEGFVGLLKAYETFDPSKAVISTYAVHCIKWQVMRYLRDRSHLVRMPRDIYTIIGKISSNKLNDSSIEEVAKKLDCDVKLAEEALNRMKKINHSSLNKEIFDDGNEEEIMALLEDRRDETVHHTEQFIERLDDRMKLIIRMYLSGYSQMEIAEHIGVSQTHISRLITKLRPAAAKHFMLKEGAVVS